LPDLGKRPVDGRAKFRDLQAGAHLHREGDGARFFPAAGRGVASVKIQERRRAHIRAGHIGQVAQVDRLTLARRHEHACQLLLRLEFTRRVDAQLARADLERAAGIRDVPRRQHIAQLVGIDAEGPEAFLRVLEEYPLLENARSRDL
jgi:hypothetical protein